MGNLPPAVLIGVFAGVLVVVGVVLATLRARARAPNWDQIDDGSASELLPPEPRRASEASGSASAQAAPAGSVFARLVDGLARTRGQVVDGLDALFRGRKSVDESLWGDLEELLVTSDVGIKTTTRLLETMRATAAREELEDADRLRAILREEVLRILAGRAGSLPDPAEQSDGPLVIMVVGVNGAGKTTTIGKLAAQFVKAGHKTLIAAGDTFRAAAIEQVVVWGRRAGAEVIRNEAHSDPAAVAHDAVSAGLARGAAVVICDTAGRLHTKSDLMEELRKVHRVIGKVQPGAPHEVLLVLDSTNGQNAIAQARQFSEVVGVTGIALTKLDGTARGGVIIGIADELDIPVKLIGIGEGMDDLRAFEPEAFVRALFDGDHDSLGRGSNSAAEAAKDVARGITVEETLTDVSPTS